MKKIGIIGGFGPESTTEYYRLIIEKYRQQKGNSSLPDIIIYSMDMYVMLDMVGQKRWDELTLWILEGVKNLHRAGADFGVISANTPHIVFNQLKKMSPIPLISIVEEAKKKSKSLGLQKVGLLGTVFTMRTDYYQKAFVDDKIVIVVPRDEEQEYIQEKLMNEIELGIFLEDTRKGLLKIVQRMVEEDSIQAVILGCTELPLILKNDEFGLPFLNTTKIHVDSIIRSCLQD